MASTSLTGIFTPGSPALVESLRTLTLEPKRTAAPGESIRAEFSFSNLGGASATSVRVRFAHPQGATHVAEADLVDDRPLTEGGRFIDATGALIGDLEPNQQRKVSCTFRVNDPVEDGTELVFQAALVSDQTPLLASNIERVVVRSRPVLANASTLVSLSAPDHPRPGDTLAVRATVENSGSSSAHDVVVLLPAPEHTTYVPRSGRIDGRLVLGVEGEPFDYDSATVVCERLAPGQSVSVEYQATIDSPLPDNTRVKAVGSVGSRECSEFAIASAETVVASPVDFSTEDTALSLLCDDAVVPGMRIPVSLRAVNAGTGAAEFVSVSFALPPGLVYAPGSAHVDGQPVGDDAIAGLTFSLGTLDAGRVVEVGLAVTVVVPASAETALPVEAALRWKGGERDFSRRLALRTSARFNRARNFVQADQSIARARDRVRFIVHVYNDGTAAERNVRLRVIPGVHLDGAAVAESADEPLPYREPLDLGIVPPHHERVFIVTARVASKVPDRSNVTLGAVLEHDAGAIDLGTATVVVRSRPHVAAESVAWEVAANEPLRPHRYAEVVIRFANSGSDVLRDARLTLDLPPELVVERAVDARRDRDGLVFGDVPAETTYEARMTLRLLRAVPYGRTLMLEGWLGGKGISPVQFAPLDVPTLAQPEFAQSAQLLAAPSELVNAGERVYYEIRVRNEGDGPAQRLIVRVVPTNLAVYVPSSTTLNGLAIADDTGMSQLWSQRGMVLADVNPGVELRIRWEMSVISPLPAGTMLETRAVLDWGDGQSIALAAPALSVQAQPSLGETTVGTPLSIARIFPTEEIPYEPPALPEAETPYAPPAPPKTELPPRAIAEAIAEHADRLAPADALAESAGQEIAPVAGPVVYIDFAADRLEHTLKLLERSDAGGLIQHLFALRMLFPESAVGVSPQVAAAFASTSRTLRAPLERFFVRLRMPRLTVTGKDLEDRESRAALRGLLEQLVQAPPGAVDEPPAGIVRIEGPINVDMLRALIPELDTAPLGAVTPWVVNAQLLGTTVLHDGRRDDAIARYRADVLKVLTVLSELPIDEFHRVLTTSVNRLLDESLADVLDALRGAAHLAAG